MMNIMGNIINLKFPLKRVIRNLFYIFIILVQNLFGAEIITHNENSSVIFDYNHLNSLSRVGDYGYPTDPTQDRAKGYLLKGKAKTAVFNYGNFIDWDNHPAGFWGDYGYIPTISFMVAIPGHEYSSKWSSPGNNSWTEWEYLGGDENITFWTYFLCEHFCRMCEHSYLQCL